MKAGKTLTELAQELERQSETKKDYQDLRKGIGSCKQENLKIEG